MYINPQDLLAIIASVCLVVVSGFLCWALYETARLMRQSNEVVTETREKITAVETFVDELVEKASSLSSYMGMLTKAGETILGMIGSARDREADEDITPPKKRHKLAKAAEEDLE
ncbi:MAG TPA: hypothetical protein VMU11_00165 [Verrucomicrobiae bacterium]|nr:hypothetical protein [Verrucomicrobiae bacterium]